MRALCTETNVLMVADEIQSGLGRSGTTFACDHEGVVPDIYVLGKALGGGLYPVSAIAADHDVLDVITPGSHGSTFGGNPLAAAIGAEVVAMLQTGEFQAAAVRLGERLEAGLAPLVGNGFDAVRIHRRQKSARLGRMPEPDALLRHEDVRKIKAGRRAVNAAQFLDGFKCVCRGFRDRPADKGRRQLSQVGIRDPMRRRR